jgi:hypothetical protein
MFPRVPRGLFDLSSIHHGTQGKIETSFVQIGQLKIAANRVDRLMGFLHLDTIRLFVLQICIAMQTGFQLF